MERQPFEGTPVPAPPGPLEAARRGRAELHESLLELEQALAAPAPGRSSAWAARVGAALVRLRADLDRHVTRTEGPDGLYRDVLTTAPRLAHMVRTLESEHTALAEALDALARRLDSEPGGEEWVTRVRDDGTSLLGRFTRHRQRGADLVFEAYEADLGGTG